MLFGAIHQGFDWGINQKQKVVAAALVIPVCFCFCLSPPISSASLSPSGTWEHLWNNGDTSGRNAHNAWSIPSALVPVAGNWGAIHSIHHSPTCRSDRSWNMGRRNPYALLLSSGWRFTSRQPMSSGATCSAGRAKKALGSPGRSWMDGMAMGVA